MQKELGLWSVCRSGAYIDLEHWTTTPSGLCTYQKHWVALPCVDIFPIVRKYGYPVPYNYTNAVKWVYGDKGWKTKSSRHREASDFRRMESYIRHTPPGPAQVAVSLLQQMQTVTTAVVFKVGRPQKYPDGVKAGQDLDVMVASLKAASHSLQNGVFSGGIKVEHVTAQQQHVDFWSEGKLVFRIDLSLAPQEILDKSVVIVSTARGFKGLTFRIPLLEHECQLRWKEWKEWVTRRPEKIKHLKWNREHGCPHNLSYAL
jgi:hypothetical protein